MINFQNWLDRVSQTFFDDDFPTYADHVSSPFVLITTKETIIARDTEALRKGFEGFRDMLHSQGATDMIRLAAGVTPIGSNILSGVYDTHILRSGQRLFEPFRSTMILRNEDGQWRASAISNAMTNTRWPIHLPTIDTEPNGPPEP